MKIKVGDIVTLKEGAFSKSYVAIDPVSVELVKITEVFRDVKFIVDCIDFDIYYLIDTNNRFSIPGIGVGDLKLFSLQNTVHKYTNIFKE